MVNIRFHLVMLVHRSLELNMGTQDCKQLLVTVLRNDQNKKEESVFDWILRIIGLKKVIEVMFLGCFSV